MSQENLSKRHLIERCLDALADMPFGAQCQFQSLRFRGQKSVAEDKLLTLLAEDLSSTWRGLPWRGLAYLLGTACAVFHVGAGTWGLFASSGRGQASLRARVRAAWAIGAISAVMWIGFANVVVLHATGAAFFGRSSSQPSPPVCPSGSSPPSR